MFQPTAQSVPPTAGAEEVSRLAAIYCLRTYPTLWTAGVAQRVESGWVVPIRVHYPTGRDCEIGQLAYDGREFTPLTDRAVMAEVVRKIEADLEFQRQWHEQFAVGCP